MIVSVGLVIGHVTIALHVGILPSLQTQASIEREALKVADAASSPLADPTDILRAALGLDPALPWDSFLEDPSAVSATLRGTMERQHLTSLLRVHLGARIMAERILAGSWEGETAQQLLVRTWLALKARHNGSLLLPPDLWHLPTVLREESSRLGRLFSAASPRRVRLTLPLFLRAPTSQPQPSFHLASPLPVEFPGSRRASFSPHSPSFQPSDCSLGAPNSPLAQSCLAGTPLPTLAVSPSTQYSQAPPPGPRRTRRGARGKRLPDSQSKTSPPPSPLR